MGQNVIELNGKRYDAITGAYLGKSSVIPKHITDQYIHGKVIDGFVRPGQTTGRRVAAQAAPQPKETPKAAAKAASETKPAAPKPTQPQASTKPTHASASHLKAHAPQRASTLMHRGVQKPKFAPKPAIKVQAPAEIMAKPQSAIMRKRSAYGVDPSRQERAVLVNQHQAVRHFHPVHKATHAPGQVPVIQVRPVPLAIEHKPKPAKTHTDIFEAAIARASSHEQPAHKHRKHRSTRRKLVNGLAIVATFLVIGSFIGYLNLPQLELRVASIQAGFGASMPTYAPTGYALDDIKHNGGVVSLRFHSGEQNYTITQQSSNWNSQTLLDNTLALNGTHKTVQKNGQTIYIYDDGTSASWVNGGVRYDISGNAQLTNDDIITIATSL